MAGNDGQEKTEQPTSKRRADARKKGQIPRSRELNTLLILLFGAGGLIFMGGRLIDGLTQIMTSGLQVPRAELFDETLLIPTLAQTIVKALYIVAPFFVLMVIVALAAPTLLSGWSFSAEAIGFKWSKLDPIKGLGRVFSWRGLVELLKALVKFILVISVAAAWLWGGADTLMQLGKEPLEAGLAHLANELGWAFLMFSAALVLVVAVDVPFQLWDHTRQLRMTRQEVRDEHKESEGTPEVKGRMRQMQREIAKRRMMQEVPNADVIVTNPTHYSVALRYDQENMKAPVVVAKGADLVAMQIRSIGTAHNVPIVSAPPLARALYFNTELEQEIPAPLYMAVAQLLAYVYQLQHASDDHGTEPEVPDFPIPDDLKRD
jgi:flagellar biosynthetic protein FlhB